MGSFSFYCAMFKHGKLMQNQYYTFSKDVKKVRIEQKSISVGNDNTEMECNFTFQPESYTEISILITDDNKVKHQVQFSYQVESNSYVLVNEVKNEDVDITPYQGHVLIDGPNPLFDFVNTIYLLGILDSERMKKLVYFLNPKTGLFQRCTYDFYRVANTIYITKDELDISGELTLSEHTSALMEARYSNGEHYAFEYPG
jgi:hypothetical protein